MDMTGENRIAAPREIVWEALNDPEALKICIPGCESVTKTSDTSFEAKVKAKVGPVSATFIGAVTLSDLNPPESYTISGEGKGGVAGFAKGGAKVHLEEAGNETILHYQVQAQVGGKLAQIGARLIDGTAKKLAEEFFANLATLVAERSGPAIPAASEPVHDDHGHDDHDGHGHVHAAHQDHDHDDHGHDDHGHHPEPPPGLTDKELNRDVGAGVKTGVWVAGLIAVVLILLAIFGLGGGEAPPAH